MAMYETPSAGVELKKLRIGANLTQRELADLMHLKSGASIISQWECGKAMTPALLELARRVCRKKSGVDQTRKD